MTECKACVCEICKEEFTSKTKLFKHLIHHGYESTDKRGIKVVLLAGWLSSVVDDHDIWINERSEFASNETTNVVENAIFKALYAIENNLPSVADIHSSMQIERPKGYSRGCSIQQRTSLIFDYEPSCHAQSDTFCFYVKSIGAGGTEGFVAKMNEYLPSFVKVFHCYMLTGSAAADFHAETECTQRRYEYIIPLKFVMPSTLVHAPDVPVVRRNKHRVDNLPKVSKHGLMDQTFPLDTADGQVRVAFFRKLKSIFKTICGKHKFHNFVTAGAAPADSSVSRRLDRFYHKELLNIRGELWVVFSISGDSILRGQVRKILGLAIGIALGFLPDEYINEVFKPSMIMEIPALPGWALYLAECRYACYEAKYNTSFRLDPRREVNGNTSNLDDWKEQVHYHIAEIAEKHGERSFQAFQKSCQEILERHTLLKQFTSRSLSELTDTFKTKFGSDPPVYDFPVDEGELEAKEEEAEEDLLTKKIEEQDDVNENEPEKEATIIEDSNTSNPTTTNESERATSPTEKTSESIVVTGEVSSTGRKGVDDPQFMKHVSQLVFVDVPIDMDDTPYVYREVVHLLRLADRSQLWPASSTGRQQVIMSTTLLENGGRGGSFSVGALPKHLVQPKGNDLFPGK